MDSLTWLWKGHELVRFGTGRPLQCPMNSCARCGRATMLPGVRAEQSRHSNKAIPMCWECRGMESDPWHGREQQRYLWNSEYCAVLVPEQQLWIKVFDSLNPMVSVHLKAEFVNCSMRDYIMACGVEHWCGAGLESITINPEVPW